MRLRDLIRYPYKYVEPCPICGSRCTGRFVKEPLTERDMKYIELGSLRHGEIVRFIYRVPEENTFCVDCGAKWASEPRTIFLSKEAILREIEERGTRAAYEELRQELEEKRREK